MIFEVFMQHPGPTHALSLLVKLSTSSLHFTSVLAFSGLLLASSLMVASSAIAVSQVDSTAMGEAIQASSTQNELAQATQIQQRIRRGDRPPSFLANAVRQDLARKVGTAPGRLKITESKRTVWNDSCLGLPSVNEICSQGQDLPGWQITLSNGQQTWVYHTDNMGQNLRLAPAKPPAPPAATLPKAIADAILQEAAQQLKLAVDQVAILQAEQKTWPDGCLGLATAEEGCTAVVTPGWSVVVGGNQQRLVYRTNESGSLIRLDTAASNLQPANLPRNVTNAVLRAAAQQLNVNASAIRIVRFSRETWPDSCLGISEPNIFCAAMVVPGWLVAVESENQRLVYRTNETGSTVKLDRGASNMNGPSGLKPETIPTDEFIPPLPRGTIFRAVTSGGITGQTSAIVLGADGQLSQGQLNRDGSVNRVKTVQISPKQVQQFRQLLAQQNFSQFNRLSYPAPVGAADYITVTLTGQAGTTRYADLVGDQLPPELQVVVRAWNEIAGEVQ